MPLTAQTGSSTNPDVGGMPSSEEGLVTSQPDDGVLRYDEGLLVGYRGYDRAGATPLYPFGHGLGYSSWTYLSVRAPREANAGADVAIEVSVRNAGSRTGREVIQLYASRAESGSSTIIISHNSVNVMLCSVIARLVCCAMSWLSGMLTTNFLAPARLA